MLSAAPMSINCVFGTEEPAFPSGQSAGASVGQAEPSPSGFFRNPPGLMAGANRSRVSAATAAGLIPA